MIVPPEHNCSEHNEERRAPGPPPAPAGGELGLVCRSKRKIDRGEKMRADAKKARRPEEPFFIALRIFDGDVQAEPGCMPIVGCPVDQHQEEKEESPPAFLSHETDAEFASLVV